VNSEILIFVLNILNKQKKYYDFKSCKYQTPDLQDVICLTIVSSIITTLFKI